MKTKFAYLLMAAVFVQVNATDSRVVNGIQVDLQPIHDWIKAPRGDRPMPHWQKAALLEYRGLANGAHVVVAKIEGREAREILINRPDRPLMQILDKQRALAAQLGRATLFANVAAAQETAVQGLSDSGIAMGSAGFVNQNVARWQQNANTKAAAAARAQITETQRQALQKELTAVDQSLAKSYELILSTRRVIGGRELFECGRY